MEGQERALRERFAGDVCTACGAIHHASDMLVLAQRDSRWLVLLTCSRCQHRGIFVARFPKHSDSVDAQQSIAMPAYIESAFGDLSADRLNPSMPQAYGGPSPSDSPTDSASTPQSHERTPNFGPVTQDDVERVTRFLEHFNGDFFTLFGRPGASGGA